MYFPILYRGCSSGVEQVLCKHGGRGFESLLFFQLREVGNMSQVHPRHVHPRRFRLTGKALDNACKAANELHTSSMEAQRQARLKAKAKERLHGIIEGEA